MHFCKKLLQISLVTRENTPMHLTSALRMLSTAAGFKTLPRRRSHVGSCWRSHWIGGQEKEMCHFLVTAARHSNGVRGAWGPGSPLSLHRPAGERPRAQRGAAARPGPAPWSLPDSAVVRAPGRAGPGRLAVWGSSGLLRGCSLKAGSERNPRRACSGLPDFANALEWQKGFVLLC